MAESKLFKNDLVSKLVASIVIIIVGIAFCFSIDEGTKLVSILIGISTIVGGTILLVVTALVHRAALTFQGIVGALLIALGIYIIVGNLVQIIVGFVPYLLLSLGGLVLGDAFLRFFWKKSIGTVGFVFILIAATVLIALGICFLLIPEFAKFAGIALGATLIVYGLADLTMTLVKAKKDKKEEEK